MKREEAIDVLKHNYPSVCFTNLCEAVEIAIKALEQPEITYCKDCKHYYAGNRCEMHEYLHFNENDFCSYAEMKQEKTNDED